MLLRITNIITDWPNGCIFNYLMEWHPNALKSPCRCYTLLQKVFACGQLFYDSDNLGYFVNDYPIGNIKMVLEAGLRYFPNELGLLFLENNDFEFSPFDLATLEERRYRAFEMEVDAGYDSKWRSYGWMIIEECLEESVDLNFHEVDPDKNIYPFMIAAADKSSE